MRLVLLGAVAALTTGPAIAQSVYVQPHVNSDGTFVEGHYRSAPNNTTTDNWSTRGNVNPYTGQQGTRDPYPQPRQSSSPYASSYQHPHNTGSSMDSSYPQ